LEWGHSVLWYERRMARKSGTPHDHEGEYPEEDSRDEDSRDEDSRDEDFCDAELDDHAAADRERFSSETALCPECGAAVWDAADICPKCFAWIDGDTRTRKRRGVHHPVIRHVVVWLLISAFLLGAGVVGFMAW
jgi:hypothetical protein